MTEQPSTEPDSQVIILPLLLKDWLFVCSILLLYFTPRSRIAHVLTACLVLASLSWSFVRSRVSKPLDLRVILLSLIIAAQCQLLLVVTAPSLSPLSMDLLTTTPLLCSLLALAYVNAALLSVRSPWTALRSMLVVGGGSILCLISDPLVALVVVVLGAKLLRVQVAGVHIPRTYQLVTLALIVHLSSVTPLYTQYARHLLPPYLIQIISVGFTLALAGFTCFIVLPWLNRLEQRFDPSWSAIGNAVRKTWLPAAAALSFTLIMIAQVTNSLTVYVFTGFGVSYALHRVHHKQSAHQALAYILGGCCLCGLLVLGGSSLALTLPLISSFLLLAAGYCGLVTVINILAFLYQTSARATVLLRAGQFFLIFASCFFSRAPILLVLLYLPLTRHIRDLGVTAPKKLKLLGAVTLVVCWFSLLIWAELNQFGLRYLIVTVHYALFLGLVVPASLLLPQLLFTLLGRLSKTTRSLLKQIAQYASVLLVIIPLVTLAFYLLTGKLVANALIDAFSELVQSAETELCTEYEQALASSPELSAAVRAPAFWRQGFHKWRDRNPSLRAATLVIIASEWESPVHILFSSQEPEGTISIGDLISRLGEQSSLPPQPFVIDHPTPTTYWVYSLASIRHPEGRLMMVTGHKITPEFMHPLSEWSKTELLLTEAGTVRQAITPESDYSELGLAIHTFEPLTDVGTYFFFSKISLATLNATPAPQPELQAYIHSTFIKQLLLTTSNSGILGTSAASLHRQELSPHKGLTQVNLTPRIQRLRRIGYLTIGIIMILFSGVMLMRKSRQSAKLQLNLITHQR